MIKLICFDLDGTLADIKNYHYLALNQAISEILDPRYIISIEDHLKEYDGLPTQDKLCKLYNKHHLNNTLLSKISNRKQEITLRLITTIKRDEEKEKICQWLRDNKYRMYCCSNSIYQTTDIVLRRLLLKDYMGQVITNDSDEISFPKPHSQMYLQAMVLAGVNPYETLIFEDSPVGITAAQRSGANVAIVKNAKELTLNFVQRQIEKYNKKENNIGGKYSSEKLNVLIPMAGLGSRFEKAGYTFPKPLIDINNKPMIQVVVDSLKIDANYIFIVQKSHYEKYNLGNVLRLICGKNSCNIIQIDGQTQGAACTVLKAKEFIDNDCPLLIANSDQYIDWNPLDFFYKMESQNLDGGILTFDNSHPKWSYAAVDNDCVKEIAEKNPISNHATCGIYYWKQGEECVWGIEEMIKRGLRVNSEFYLAPSINMSIERGLKFKIYNVDRMAGIGTPEDLQSFLQNPIDK